MDASYSESDVSMSPTQILERLQVLRQMQLMQRGKLQKQRLQYQETAESSSSITEIVSQFSDTTSYNTFRSLLQSCAENSNDISLRVNNSNISQKVREQDLLEGVSVLNLSQESEFIDNSPLSSQSIDSIPSKIGHINGSSPSNNSRVKLVNKKHISLDEMPVLSPKLDFESLVKEKLKNEKVPSKVSPKKDCLLIQSKKPFLKRGEGMARFGLKKNDLVIQNTKALPWRQKTKTMHAQEAPIKDNVNIEIAASESEPMRPSNSNINFKSTKFLENKEKSMLLQQQQQGNNEKIIDSSNCELHSKNKSTIQVSKKRQPLVTNKGKTWAAILTKEQDDFLRKLKQSDYYKNFVSPAKSAISDISCDENLNKLKSQREIAEQNMFELLERKVCNESFHLQNSFFNKFFKKNSFECSGESTPLVLQKCLASNPELLNIFPGPINKNGNDNSQCQTENNCDCTDCCSDEYSSVSSCCSCKTVESANGSTQECLKNKQIQTNLQKGQLTDLNKKEQKKIVENDQCQGDTVKEDTMQANMADMNAKLIATSELLKDRLRELEDEIETFRTENAHLSKMREEIDQERQKFYEEKNIFEQKFHEEKILSEYYLAEEKEKLTKQKQTYERYVREMRGRLNKKEKDEVINLKKEINDLKDEIRIKDAKSTSTIARLRNQLKLMEKEKKDLKEEVEKLKKENRRIQHSNDITRRLTNMKYLEEINKKLSHISSKNTQSEVEIDQNLKYKAFEIDRQSRSRKIESATKGTIRPRAKSVPNLKVTSRYAKYFSQRDAVSEMEKDKTLNMECFNRYGSDTEDIDNNGIMPLDGTESNQDNDISDDENENHLEKIYRERFQPSSPTSITSNLSNNNCKEKQNPDAFFVRKSNSSSNRDSRSPNPNSKPTSPYPQNSNSLFRNKLESPLTIGNHGFSDHKSPVNSMKDLSNISQLDHIESYSQRSRSPVSILSTRTSYSQKPTVISQIQYKDKLAVSPEPSSSKTSLTKTNLNPTEIKKPDGSRELRFPNGNVKFISADGKYTKFVYYNGDIKENFYDEGRIKYYYVKEKTFHTTHADGLEVLEFPNGHIEKRYKDGSTEIRLPNGSIRYFDPKNEHVREEWRFPDGTSLTVSANGEQRIVFTNGQIEVHTKDHKRREFPDGTVKLVYNDETSETRYASGRVRIKDKHGNLIMDSAPG